MMHIFVRLAEPFWRVVGQRELEIDLPENAQVQDLLTRLCQQYPALAGELSASPPIIFSGDEEVSPDDILNTGDRIHLVWAVAGG